jgi:hypothetical protein
MERKLKSERVVLFAALEIVKDLITSLAGLCVASPGFDAVILQMPEERMCTVRLFTREQTVGVVTVVVVVPALWVMLRPMFGSP